MDKRLRGAIGHASRSGLNRPGRATKPISGQRHYRPNLAKRQVCALSGTQAGYDVESVRDAIIEKLNRHMSIPPKTEADVVYALVEIRKLLEQSGRKEDLPRLTFFCDWVVHPWLKGTETQNVLKELDERLGKYDTARPWELDPDGHVHELLSFRRFREELHAYSEEVGIQEGWTRDPTAWREVSRLYSMIVRDCPLSMSRQGYDFNYLAQLEISGCEPSEVVTNANPHMNHIGWSWKFTLNDGRTFNMPFTAGYAKA